MTETFEGGPDLTGATHPTIIPKDTDMTTTVISLKGRIRDHGPRLEHAPDRLVYVGRRMAPRKRGNWDLAAHPLHNPYSAKLLGSNEEAVAAYCRHLLQEPGLLARVPLLRGSTLACWCAPDPCHADVLAVLAEADRAEYPALLEARAAGSDKAERDAAAVAEWMRRTSGK